jgi:uncharacterized membrane protein
MSQPNYDQQSQHVYQQQNAVGDIHNYQADPLEDIALYQESSRRAKTLVTIGTLLIISGFVIFGASLFLSTSTDFGSIPSLPTEEMFEWVREQGNQQAAAAAQSFTLALMGFGVIFVGMIVAAIGSWQARKEAYRRRMSTPRR